MTGDPQISDKSDAAALLGWWIESGVDVAVSEEARDWRKQTPAPPAQVASSSAVRESEDMPSEFAAFRDWLEQSTDLPLAMPGARRVLPRGESSAEIMLMTDVASVEDDGEPIGGEALLLTGRMLAAIGFSADKAYLANLSCFSSPGSTLGGADLERCVEIARQHIALAAPKRLILFGDGPSRAFLGGPVTQRRGKIHKVEGARTIATFAPRWLLQRPADKALAWRDLLLLMEE
jgi:DNA polymerase